MAFSPDGQHVLLLSNGGQLLDWNIESGRTSRGSVNANGSVGLQFTVSPDGNQIAVLSVDPTGNSQQYAVNLYDRHLTPLKQFPVGDMARSIAFCSSGKSLAVLGDDLEILDLGSGATPRRNIPLSDYASMLAASADATKLALSDGLTVYVLDGNQSHKLGGIGSAGGSLFYLIFAFLLVFGLFRMMRKRRMMKKCVDCGKKWQEVKRRPAARLVQCPDCRLEYLPTDELRKRLGDQKRRGLRVWIGVLVFLAALSTWGTGLDDRSAWEIAWLAVRSLLGWAAVFVVLFALILVVVVAWRQARLRQFGKSGYALRSAQKAAASEGSSEQIGTMVVWTDLLLQNPLPLGEGRVRVQETARSISSGTLTPTLSQGARELSFANHYCCDLL
jgi:DNA-directed RNA polymerase subunit RPC12/RpoP